MAKLTALGVKKAGPGKHGDGGGLYLLVKPSGARSWVLRVQHNGRRRDIGLGALSDLSLSAARDRAAQFRFQMRQGVDVVADRRHKKMMMRTFAQATEAAHKALAAGWSDKTGAAFLSSLKEHAYPVLGQRRVGEIASRDVIDALAPIWTAKPQQARKIRHRIMQVLAFAKSHGWRDAPLPEAVELRRGLAKQPRSQGFAAVPFADVPQLVADELAKDHTAGRLALLFTILTAARSGEVRGARWEQIDLQARTWTRPAELMKSGLEHVVTLSPAALAVLDLARQKFGPVGLVFPSAKRDVALSDMALGKVLRAAGRAETVHGFRSSFRDWAAEKMPSVPAMVAEMALAHSVGNATEKAYLRSDLRDLRRELMGAWGAFVAPGLGAV